MIEVPAKLLHPWAADPGAHESHVGGPLLWPADEPWPTCTKAELVRVETLLPPELAARANHPDTFLAAVSEINTFVKGRAAGTMTTAEGTFAISYAAKPHGTPNPMVVIGQFYAGEFPEIVFPEGTDVLQILWCPAQHVSNGDPEVHVAWRQAAEVDEVHLDPPLPHIVDEGYYLPKPCKLRLEPVLDTPWWQELPDDLGRQMRTMEIYPISSGWKIGGCASWAVTDLMPMDCPVCDERMKLALTITSGDGDAGVEVGRYASMRIFTCVTDRRWGVDIQ